MKHALSTLLLYAMVGYAAAAIPVSEVQSLVFGSFNSFDNASNLASRLSHQLGTPVEVASVSDARGTWFRVATAPGADLSSAREVADRHKLSYWRLMGSSELNEVAESTLSREAVAAAPDPVSAVLPLPEANPERIVARTSEKTSAVVLNRRELMTDVGNSQLDFDLGLQTRTYPVDGFSGQSRFQPSLSAKLDYYRTWNNGQRSLTFTPYLRYDVEDSERSHFDVRELFVSHVGSDWDLHVGVKQVFWGVTEFHHLVDVLNQTDLVENIDGEDKLGQPMVHVSLVRDWGILDIFALVGFRERTFPGEQGRLRSVPMVAADRPIYESGAENTRVDGAIRWSYNVGPIEFGVYHFTGTSREPQLIPWVLPSGEMVLRPRYPVIDQTGLDALAVLGDWAVKLEAITRSGYGPRYSAFNLGVEKTLVGIMGSRTDLGLVAEYMFDERDDKAFNTIFEHDFAIGTRWSLNDLADTQALLGIIWDVDTDEYVFSMEASRRLGETWTLLLEGRVFGGADEPDSNALLQSLFDVDNKTASLQRDDFIQLELTRYF